MTNADLQRVFEEFTNDVERIVIVPGDGRIPRRARQRRRVALGVASAAAAVLVAVGISVHGSLSQAPNAGSTPVTRPGGSQVPVRSAIQGDWRTRPLSRADVARTLDAAGLHRYAASYVSRLPRHPFRMALRVRGDLVEVWQGDSLVDSEHFTLGDSRLETRALGDPGAEPSSHYAWRRHGQRLRLTFMDSQVPAYNGYPAEVTLRALFTVAPFVRHR
jgi:hypothetical protein